MVKSVAPLLLGACASLLMFMPSLAVQPAWQAIQRLPSPRAELCAVSLPAPAGVLAIGGTVMARTDHNLGEQVTTTALLARDDPMKWTAGPALNHARSAHKCAVMRPSATTGDTALQSYMVAVVGGMGSAGGQLGSIETLTVTNGNLGEAQWELSSVELTPAREGAAVTAVPGGNYLVIVGGFVKNASSGEFFYLDETLKFDGHSLVKLAPLPFKRADLSLVTLPIQKQLLAFGGGATDPAYNETVTFDIASGIWTTSKSVLTKGAGRNWAAAAVLTLPKVGDIAIVVGGFSREPFFDLMSSTECWLGSAAAWQRDGKDAATHPCLPAHPPPPCLCGVSHHMREYMPLFSLWGGWRDATLSNTQTSLPGLCYRGSLFSLSHAPAAPRSSGDGHGDVE